MMCEARLRVFGFLLLKRNLTYTNMQLVRAFPRALGMKLKNTLVVVLILPKPRITLSLYS